MEGLNIQLEVIPCQIACINYRTAYERVEAPLYGESSQYKSITDKLKSPERTNWLLLTEDEFHFVYSWCRGE